MRVSTPLNFSRQALDKRWLLLGAVGYAVLFVGYSWPLAQEFRTAFVGYGQGDANQYVWNAYNFRQQVAAGGNPFHTSLLLFPEGTGLWLHTYTPVLGVLNVLLNQPLLAVNTGLLLSFMLSGVGAARLAGRWLKSPLLCLLTGFIFAFSPYKLAHWPEHYHLLLTATAPFYVSAFLNAFVFTPGRWLPGLRHRVSRWWCVGLLLLTFFSDYYTLAGLLYFSAGYAAWFGLALGAVNWHRRRPWLVLVAVGVGAHIASRLLTLAGVPDNAGFWWGGDLAGYLLPPAGSRWLASAATNAVWQSTRFNMPGSVENVVFLGYAVPVVALVLAVLRRRSGPLAGPAVPDEARPLWALALLFFLLTLPVVKLLGHTIVRPLTGLVHFVPFFNNIRCPTRYVLLLTLLLPLATFVGLERHWQVRPSRWHLPLAAGLALLVGLEFQPLPYPLIRQSSVPVVYKISADLPGRALYPIPLGLLDGYRQTGQFNPAELFYQTYHHKPLPGCYISRVPAATFAAFAAFDPVQRALLVSQQHPDSLGIAVPNAAQTRAFLRRYQPAAFVISPPFRTAPVHLLLRRILRPVGYRERVIDGYTLLQPSALP